jgi:putative FmdB family regulatory protein
MPTYDYECPKGHSFEVFQKMTSKPVAKCPECGAKARRKISGGAGFLFKGEGFYITDYRSDDYKQRASSEVGVAPAKDDAAKPSEDGVAPSAEKAPASTPKKTVGESRSKGAGRSPGAKRSAKKSGR